jgi:hypothetical protein
METQNEKPITKNHDLLFALIDFNNHYPIIGHFYSVHLNCGNEIRMQGHFTDMIYDLLLADKFVIVRQRKMDCGDLSIELSQTFNCSLGEYNVVIVLIDKKS